MAFKVFLILFICFLIRKCVSSEKPERIVQGTLAKPGQFPYVVFIRAFLGPYEINQCTGSILTELWVVTAAHCYRKTMESCSGNCPVPVSHVMAGQVDTTKGETPNGQFRKSVQLELMEEDPNKKVFTLMNNDIAILKVNSPFVFNEHVGPITVAKRPLHKGKKLTCVVMGFGRTDDFNRSSIGVLYYSHSTFDGDLFSCAKRIPKDNTNYNAEDFDEGYICVDPVDYYSAICSTDSGGPLICDGLQAGIASGTANFVKPPGTRIDCGMKGNYDLYQSLGFHEDWLRNFIPELPPFKLLAGGDGRGGGGGGGGRAAAETSGGGVNRAHVCCTWLVVIESILGYIRASVLQSSPHA